MSSAPWDRMPRRAPLVEVDGAYQRPTGAGAPARWCECGVERCTMRRPVVETPAGPPRVARGVAVRAYALAALVVLVVLLLLESCALSAGGPA